MVQRQYKIYILIVLQKSQSHMYTFLLTEIIKNIQKQNDIVCGSKY